MLTDPQSVTVNAVAQSMPRVSSSGTSSKYQKADETFSLSISHTKDKSGRIRSLARIDQRAIVQNPLDLTNDYDTLTWYVVLDRPSYGFTMTQAEQLATGFLAWLNTAMVDKIWGQES
jgi:hypothetical protein